MPTSDNPIAKPQPLSTDALEAYWTMADAIAQTTHYMVTLFDTYSKKHLYISKKRDLRLNGFNEIIMQQDFEWHINRFLDEERTKLRVAHKSLKPILAHIDSEERKQLTMVQNHHYLLPNNRKVLVYKRISTITFNSDGTPRIVMALFSLSQQQDGLFWMLNNPMRKEYHTYNFADKQWEKHAYEQLTDNEIHMIMLSRQGHGIGNIATIMNKSTDTVKGYRKAVFDKLNVTNIQSAIVRILDYKLFEYQSNSGE